MAWVNVHLTKGERVLTFNFLCALTSQTVDELRRIKDIKAGLGTKGLDLEKENTEDLTRSLVPLTEGDSKWLLKKLNDSNVFNGQQDELVLGLIDALENGLKEYKKQEI